MADDWIKMRGNLHRNQKVIRMAEQLLAEGGMLDGMFSSRSCHTRHIVRHAVVSALLSVWSAARHAGKRVGHALQLSGATKTTIDDWAGWDGFATSMEAVEWLVVNAQGVVFPMFYADHNVDPKEHKKAQQRERQKRCRDKKKRHASQASQCHAVTPLETRDKSKSVGLVGAKDLDPSHRWKLPTRLITEARELLAKVEWLIDHGDIPESVKGLAEEAFRVNAKAGQTNPVGYLWTLFRNACSDRSLDFEAMLREVPDGP